MSLIFSVESLADNWNDMIALASAHWKETEEAIRTNQPFNPSFQRYESYEKLGCLLLFTARDEGRMVGYGLIYFVPSMHTQKPILVEDTIFLLPPYRRGRNGLRFYEFVEREAVARGAYEAMVTAKPDSAAARILEHMGFTHVNNQYCKNLRADSASAEEECQRVQPVTSASP